MKLEQNYSMFIGLDWADKKHDVCIQQSTISKRTFQQIAHSPESIENWVMSLRKRTHGNIAIAIELNKGPIVAALQKYEFITIFPIHAATLANYRTTFTNSGAKNDPTDAEIALDLLLNYPNKFKPLKKQSSDVRQLEVLVEKRRELVNDRCRFSNQLISSLKQYYPQALDWFTHRGTELFCDFIIRWPTLQKLQRTQEKTIIAFFKAHGGRSTTNLNRVLELRKKAIPLTNDKAIIESYQLLAGSLAEIIKTIILSVRKFDSQIDTLFKTMEDAAFYEALPGVGPCLAPRLLVALGEDRKRFNNAAELQAYSGVAPVTVSSGQKTWIHWRWHCSKFIRQSIIEWAAKSAKSSYWASLYYDKQRAKGNSHQAAVRSLAYKWLRIIFRCWKDRKPYNEAKYLRALRKRNSPLVC